MRRAPSRAVEPAGPNHVASTAATIAAASTQPNNDGSLRPPTDRDSTSVNGMTIQLPSPKIQ
jgi:hypothetical protein